MNKKDLSLHKTIIVECFNCGKRKLYYELDILDIINNVSRCCNNPFYEWEFYKGTNKCASCRKETDSWTLCDKCEICICDDCQEYIVNEFGESVSICPTCYKVKS